MKLIDIVRKDLDKLEKEIVTDVKDFPEWTQGFHTGWNTAIHHMRKVVGKQ